MGRRRNIYVRHWRIIRALSGRRYGVTVKALEQEVGTSRSTLYRDIPVLREAGVPIVSELRNGEARYYLLDATVPPLQPTSLEVHALRLARRLLAPLDGSSLAERLDDLLARVPGQATAPRISARAARASAPDTLSKLERALAGGRRVRIEYRGSRDGHPRWRCIDPLAIHLAGEHVYLVAHDVERSAERTFKLARIHRVELLRERADRHDPVDPDVLFARSVKVWSGEVVDVAVHLAEPVAHLVPEWPLVGDQVIEEAPGGVIVRARVAGLPETVRWVLSWGRHARPLEPSELVEAVRQELVGALAALGRGRPRDRETRVVHKA